VAIKLLASANFAKNVRKLSKHYPKIADDIDGVLNQLMAGETPGDRISGVGYSAYKVRVKSSDIARGENAGFRLIYYVRTKDCVYLVTVYSKSAQQDIPKKSLKRLIDNILGYENLTCD
jgi:mRNA-degrading endonuclease RelE of RelBE toxin-antitoxin system